MAALECRSETGTVLTTATFDSKQMNWAVLGEFVLAVLVTQMDVFNRLLGTTPINLAQFGWALLPAARAAGAVGARQAGRPPVGGRRSRASRPHTAGSRNGRRGGSGHGGAAAAGQRRTAAREFGSTSARLIGADQHEGGDTGPPDPRGLPPVVGRTPAGSAERGTLDRAGRLGVGQPRSSGTS